MFGSTSSGNPNVIEDTKGKQTGPKSEMGKLKNSVSAIKHFGAGVTLNQHGDSRITKLMKEAGVDFSKVEQAIEKRNIFTIFIKSKSAEELTEIQKLDTVIQILESDIAVRAMGKLEKGIILSDEDGRIIKLLKETLESSHRMKFGTKHVNINGDFDDIRELMFGENDNPRSQ